MTELIKNIQHVLSTGLHDLGSLHPLIVHFPIALLCVAPLFILLGSFISKSAKVFYFCAFILLWLGALSGSLAVKSGEMASESIKPSPEILEAFEMHEELAEKSQTFFLILAVLFSIYFFTRDSLLSKFPPIATQLFLALFLVAYAWAILILLNTVHYGGKLVHHHGIHSNLYSKPE